MAQPPAGGFGENYDRSKDPTAKSRAENDPAGQWLKGAAEWGYGAVDDWLSAETVRGPDAGSYYYGGSKGYMPARAGMLDQRGDLAYSQGQQSLDMTRQAALGKGPSAAAQLARAQSDAAQRGALSMARSGRAGTGSSATRDALFANAQTQQSGIQAAALARSQEQMAAQQQYAAQTMAHQQQAASEAARMREAQLNANAQYEAGKMNAATANQNADLQKDAGAAGMLSAAAGIFGMMSDERSKRRIADLEAEVDYYRSGREAEAQQRGASAGTPERDAPDADAPPDLDPRAVSEYLAAFDGPDGREGAGSGNPETWRERRGVQQALQQQRADEIRTGGGERGALAALRADMRAGQEASDTFAAMRPMAYEYEQPGPGAPPGPQVGFSAQSVQATPAGRAMTEPGPDGRLRYDGQKALQLTMAGTADQEDRLRRLEAALDSGAGDREHRVTVDARASRGDMRRRLGLERIAERGTPLSEALRGGSYYGTRGGR